METLQTIKKDLIFKLILALASILFNILALILHGYILELPTIFFIICIYGAIIDYKAIKHYKELLKKYKQ